MTKKRLFIVLAGVSVLVLALGVTAGVRRQGGYDRIAASGTCPFGPRAKAQADCAGPSEVETKDCKCTPCDCVDCKCC